MPDDDAKNNLHSIDREPSTGSHGSVNDTEHADLNHRIEAETDDAPTPVSNPVTVPVAASLPHPGPGMLVLQWLVYALWGWTVLSLSGLVFVVVADLLTKDGNSYGYSYSYGDGISYLIAAVIVLFIISLLCDAFYAKAERRHERTNGANVIMIIHAVLFALFGIGALIISVFGAVSLLIGDTADTTSSFVSIISGGIIFVLYGLTLLRTLRPRLIKLVVPAYWLSIAISIIITVTLAIVGPAAEARLKAQDRVIEIALPSLADAINDYARSNGTLPKDLNVLTNQDMYGREAQYKELIDKKLVEYKPGEKIASTSAARDLLALKPDVDQQGGTVETIYHYQLCVNYKTDDGYNSYGYDTKPDNQSYYVGVNTMGHKAGPVCYDAQTGYSE